MELFLNLCWLSLLVPAYFLWQRKTATTGTNHAPASAHPVGFVCALGCAFVLLFPVISASDDLHAMRPEMEESESSLRGANRVCTSHALAHSAQAILPAAASLMDEFEQTGTALPFERAPLGFFFAPVPAGRAPPASPVTSL